MKKEKTCAVLYYISAVLFYVVAAINLLGDNNDTSMGVVWLCLGSTMLCLGFVWLNKSKKKNDETEEK